MAGTMGNDLEKEIKEPSSNFSRDRYVLFHTNDLEKSMNPFLLQSFRDMDGSQSKNDVLIKRITPAP